MDYAELAKRLRRYPAIREEAWRLYEEGYCYDDEADNAPIETLVIEAADAIEALTSPPNEAQVVEARNQLSVLRRIASGKSPGLRLHDIEIEAVEWALDALNAAYRVRVKNEAKA